MAENNITISFDATELMGMVYGAVIMYIESRIEDLEEDNDFVSKSELMYRLKADLKKYKNDQLILEVQKMLKPKP